VRELCSRVGKPQSLVSYHLGRLRAEKLVVTRRSSADARDAYYAVDLNRCGELIGRTAEALHPGLRMHAASPEVAVEGVPLARVLFLCTGNSARSQIAQALTESLSRGTVKAVSAGSHPKPLHPHALRALAERGVDISELRPKHLEQFRADRFAYVVSLCDRVREVCPEFPGHPRQIHWSVPDPASALNGAEQSYVNFPRLLAEIEMRVMFLLETIRATERAGP